jgi:hypothetical protein
VALQENAVHEMHLRHSAWGVKLGFTHPSAKPYPCTGPSPGGRLSSGWGEMGDSDAIWPSGYQLFHKRSGSSNSNGTVVNSSSSSSSNGRSSSSCHLRGVRGAVAEGTGEIGGATSSSRSAFSRYVSVPALHYSEFEYNRETPWSRYDFSVASDQRKELFVKLFNFQTPLLHTAILMEELERSQKAREAVAARETGSGSSSRGQNCSRSSSSSSVVTTTSLSEEHQRDRLRNRVRQLCNTFDELKR